MMEILFVVFAFVLLSAGFIGSIVPVIPGPPLCFAGLLFLQWSGYGAFTSGFLWLWAAITVIVTVTDQFLPVWMTRKFGGSRWAMAGSLLGLLVGMFFFPPFGLVFGPFLGAMAGELIHDHTNSSKAIKAAFGAFLAFLFGTGIKLIVCSVMNYYAIRSFF